MLKIHNGLFPLSDPKKANSYLSGLKKRVDSVCCKLFGNHILVLIINH